MTSRSQQYLVTALLMVIAVSSGLAWFNTSPFTVPRGIFIAMTGLTLLLTIMLIFNMIYLPLRDGVYARLLPNSIVILLFVLSAIKLTISGFATDDEIYSWNMWGIQHFFGHPASFIFTGAPYPQLFSYWIASLYGAMGGITIQSIPRFFLALPTLLLGAAAIAQARILNWRMAAVISLVLVIAFGPIAVRLAKGLADPLMSAAMIVSAMLLISYAREPQKLIWLWLAVACAIVASLTKQAGLIWACFSLPATVVVGYRGHRWPKSALLLAAASLFLSAIWPLWIAPTFTHNEGVISASMGGRNYFQQFGYAIQTYLVGRPEISVLLAACVAATWRHGILRLLMFVAVLPMLLAWFLFGAYEIRLGIHVLILMALLTVCSIALPWSDAAKASDTAIRRNAAVASPFHTRTALLSAGLIVCGIFLAIWQSVLFLAEKKGIDLADGAETTLQTQFGADSKNTFERILGEKARIWTTSAYAYGPFYGRLPVGPGKTLKTIGEAKESLLEFSADYAIQSDKIISPTSQLLSELAQTCPAAFEAVLRPPNQYDFTLYKVNLKQLSKNCHD